MEKLREIELSASEVLALRLALSFIEAGAEPAGVIAAVRQREDIIKRAKEEVNKQKKTFTLFGIARLVGIDPTRLWDCLSVASGKELTFGEAQKILTTFSEQQEHSGRKGEEG